MTLGEKLKQARLEAGLSQRQLCADTVTRNMLSQIENGAAAPSMQTLRVLAGRLGKPVSWFLEEEAQSFPDRAAVERAWALYGEGKPLPALEALEDLRTSDPLCLREKELLSAMALLSAARRALEEDRAPYARILLERLPERLPLPELERTAAVLRLELGIGTDLPDLDRELRMLAEAALESGAPDRAARFLEAVEERTDPGWYLLRGRASLLLGEYAQAAELLGRAEETYPRETAQLLERCWRELGDYRRAYGYACLDRSFREKT